ncbi:peroxisome targeting signal receptor [Gloeopeniophorella convolvens]|nr:peroxisome targeting signal receptor [Gloeopeniophorella convolvens]
MSLAGLMSGAECAVEVNPLSQVLKHTDGDRSLQQDRIAGPSSSRLHHLPSSSNHAIAEHDMAMARQFFEAQQGPASGPSFSPAQMAPMQDLMARQLPLTVANRGMSSNLNNAWADVQRTQSAPALPHNAMSQAGWANEFSPAAFAHGPPVQQSATPTNTTQAQYMSGSAFGTMANRYGGFNGMPQNYLQSFDGQAPVLDIKGKGKFKETDFDAAFAQVASSFETTPAQAEALADPVVELEKDLGKTSLDDAPAATPEEVLGHVEFKNVWEQLQNSDMPPKPEEMAKWEAEFNNLMSAQREDGEWEDYSTAMQHAWEETAADMDDTFGHSVKFDHEGLPILDAYTFEEHNKYLDPSSSTQSPLAQAKMMLEQNASLSEVALLLEAAIQKGELGEGGYEAWILLGETRNMDEREELGMKALSEGVRIAEESGAAGPGMLSLAISYTNESFDRGSHTMLMRWLRARFPDAPVSPEMEDALSKSAWHSHNVVTDAFLGIARAQHADGVIDPDVQLALGVLFYTNGAYDRAKDCFEAALGARPTDYLLWNRLGSSLSNGNKPEESLGAYREALTLRPTYTRAIYNVGVACLNIGAHREAAEHLLSALSMQEATGEKSKQLWQTLRRAFLAMDRKDLADLTNENPNLNVFRSEGFEF